MLSSENSSIASEISFGYSDVLELKRKLEDAYNYNEYYNAKRRFYTFTIPSKNSTMNEEEEHLDYLISKICDDLDVDLEIESSLFFRLLFRADFIQISNDVKCKFYTKLCNIFIFTDKIHEIILEIDDLDAITHVKMDILMTLLTLMNVQPEPSKTGLILKGFSKKLWDYSNNNLYVNIDHVIISPIAYKIMFENDNVNFIHLNFILRLLKVQKLTLDGCNLNWKTEENLLNGLNLNYLSMVNCGTNVNHLIQKNFENLKTTLKELHLSECPIYNSTLTTISYFFLEKLSLRNCIKTRGYFIDNLWSELIKFGNFEDANVNINLLWQGDTLKKSLKYFDISFNDMDYNELEKIGEFKIESLDVTQTIKRLNTEISFLKNSCLVQTLKELKIRNIEIDFEILATLSNVNLEELDFTYDAVKNYGNFVQLLDKPLGKSLKRLTLHLLNHCQSFICFISNLNLRYFECLLGTWYYYNFDIFWNNEKRENLKILKLTDGKISSSDAKGISKLNLSSLSLQPFLFDSKEPILEILSSEKLQNSLVDLKIGGAYEADEDHLNLLSQFKNLEVISLKILGLHLTRELVDILALKNLKSITLRIFIGLSINEEAAHALCGLSRRAELSITLLGLGKSWPLTLTRNAYQIFSLNNVDQKYEIPIRLEFSDCILDQRCADVFKNFSVESIIFSSCVFNKNFFETLLDGKLKYTLQDLTLKRVDVDQKQLGALARVYLSKLSVMTLADDFSYNKLLLIVNSDRISKSLCVLKLAPYHCVPHIENILKTNLSVYEYYSCDSS